MGEPSMELEVAQTAYVLQSGELVPLGAGSALMNSDAVRDANLG